VSTQTHSPRPEHPIPLHGEGPLNPPSTSPLLVGTRIGGDVVERQVGAGQWPEDKPRFLWLKLELIVGSTLEEWGRVPGRTVGEVVDRVFAGTLLASLAPAA
jgi:hypothetical protein